MPLTTTSGYTFPVAGVPTTQNPGSGLSSEAQEKLSSYGSLSDYSNWNGDWLGYLQYMAGQGDEVSQDRLFNYLMSENSNQTARNWTAQREDTQYQRLVSDLKAAGINPYALITGNVSPISSSSGGSSYSGSYAATASAKDEANQAKWATVLASIITTVIMAAAIAA